MCYVINSLKTEKYCIKKMFYIFETIKKKVKFQLGCCMELTFDISFYLIPT